MNARLDPPHVDDALEDDGDDEMPAVSPELLQEWERRAADLAAGRTRGLTWDEVKTTMEGWLRSSRERLGQSSTPRR